MPPDEDYEPFYPARPQMAALRKQYMTMVEPWPKDDPTSTQFYWHLYYKGEHVNGGICDFEDQAWQTASQYKHNHQRNEFLNTFIWDEESYRWQPREYFIRE